MRKSELVQEISNQTGIEQGDVNAVVESFMKVVSKEIIDGNAITLRTFGTFTTKTRKAKTARHIHKGEPLFVPEHKIPYFKPSDYISEPLKKNSTVK